MAVHVCRDFLTDANAMAPLANVQLLSYFLSGVLGFQIVGTKNSPTFPLALANLVFASGHSGSTGAGINLGLNKEYYVSIPPVVHVVSALNQNRILALRSNANPRSNSGLFRILSQSISSNAYIIDYRVPSGSIPPVESGSLNWILFQSESRNSHDENVFSDNAAAAGTYHSFGSSSYPRMILQSPHSSSWQVRLSVESFYDRSTATMNCGNTIACGTSGDATGDFAVGGPHTHGNLFWNDNDATRRNGQQGGCDPILGGNSSWTTGQWRVYMWGDDQLGTTLMISRNSNIGANAMATFGIAENEPIPLQPQTQHRVFNIGDSVQNNPSGPTWNIGTKNEYSFTGQAFGFSGQPISCVFSTYHAMWENGFPRVFVTADNPMLQATELLPVELLAGTWSTQNFRDQPGAQRMILENRRLGQFPMARLGRTNFGNWATSTDVTRSFLHTLNGFYVQWSGPAVLP